jgi:hypothetical protein
LIRREKKKCYPEGQYILVTETSAEVNLQGLLDHTIRRIATLQEAIIMRVLPKSLKLICKWGVVMVVLVITDSNRDSPKKATMTNIYL